METKVQDKRTPEATNSNFTELRHCAFANGNAPSSYKSLENVCSHASNCHGSTDIFLESPLVG